MNIFTDTSIDGDLQLMEFALHVKGVLEKQGNSDALLQVFSDVRSHSLESAGTSLSVEGIGEFFSRTLTGLSAEHAKRISELTAEVSKIANGSSVVETKDYIASGVSEYQKLLEDIKNIAPDQFQQGIMVKQNMGENTTIRISGVPAALKRCQDALHKALAMGAITISDGMTVSGYGEELQKLSPFKEDDSGLYEPISGHEGVGRYVDLGIKRKEDLLKAISLVLSSNIDIAGTEQRTIDTLKKMMREVPSNPKNTDEQKEVLRHLQLIRLYAKSAGGIIHSVRHLLYSTKYYSLLERLRLTAGHIVHPDDDI